MPWPFTVRLFWMYSYLFIYLAHALLANAVKLEHKAVGYQDLSTSESMVLLELVGNDDLWLHFLSNFIFFVLINASLLKVEILCISSRNNATKQSKRKKTHLPDL